MSKAFITSGADGTRKIQNFIHRSDGALERVSLGYNGFAIAYIPTQDSEGSTYLKPALSVICADGEMSDALHEEGLKLLQHLSGIELP